MHRLKKAQEYLKKNQLDGLLIEAPIDLYYLTKMKFSSGRLLILEDEAHLFVDGRYFEAAKRQSFISVILTSQGFIEQLTPLCESKKIGFDANKTSFAEYQRYRALKCKLIPCLDPISHLREIKEGEEILLLKKAAQLGSEGYDYLRSKLKVGVTEKALAVELEVFWKKAGADRVAFEPHIAFGANAAFPHHTSCEKPLCLGDVVLIDIGVVFKNYHSDMTRVLFFGMPPSPLELVYTIVAEAQAKALEKCKPGTLIKDVDRAAREWIENKGYGNYFTHSIGHGIGLEIHERPWLRPQNEGVLMPGQVITIEPGIYLPNIGGVRLEDSIVITENGYENLTRRPIDNNIVDSI